MPDPAPTQQDRHGQHADSPTQLPPRGWRDVGKRVFQRISADRAMLIAAGVTYYMLMALVPALVVFVSLYGLISDPAKVESQMSLLSGIMPPGGLSILNDQLTRLTTTGAPTLSITLLASLAVSLWSAAAGMRALFDAMNIAYHEEEKRNFFVLSAMGLGFTLAVLIAAIVFLTVVVFVPAVLQFIPLPAGSAWLVRVASYALMIVLLLVGISMLYRWGPSREQAKWRWLTPGAALAVFAIALASVLFSWYTANFSNYNATYGSLGALIGLLTWIWLSVTIVIVGAEVDAELEHQTFRDSTTGTPLPLGARGAYMADHVAAVDHRRVAAAAPAATVEDARRDDRTFLITMAVVLTAAMFARSRVRRP
jgi:membrane protein